MSNTRFRRVGHAAIVLALGLACGGVAPPALHAQQLPEQSLQSHLDGERLRSVRDSFVVVLQGKASGWQRLTASREGQAWHLSDAITLDGFIRQESAIVLDAGFRQQSLRQEGDVRGKPMRIALDFADGRVTGNALTPASQTGEAVPIDTSVTASTLDDNAVLPLLAGVRWRDSLAFAFPVLASGTGSTALWSVRVLGRDTTTVPAGQFETWRVELRAERSSSVVHVTREAPYRVVHIQNGSTFRVQLVNR